MARGYRDPRKTKSRAGIRTFNKFLTTSFKVGKALTKNTISPRRTVSSRRSPQGCMLWLIGLIGIPMTITIALIQIHTSSTAVATSTPITTTSFQKP
ncbi:hypothetical protein ACTJIJ_15850 [Niabella sp. 22666]|uniref:hypothetical protein n=1 Tax=Niabella sp. 22666 TaxID=3453954 RepID=UPI003F85101C